MVAKEIRLNRKGDLHVKEGFNKQGYLLKAEQKNGVKIIALR